MIHSLETGVKDAINSFVVYCKAQGIWTAINASCILAGARTLSGALVPLKGTAPTNFNFVSGDYNRETGLKGDALTKYLDSNRNSNADPQDSFHMAVYGTELVIGGFLMSAGTSGATGRSNISATTRQCRNRTDANQGTSLTPSTPFTGCSRSSSIGFTIRANSADQAITATSVAPIDRNIFIFGTSTIGSALSTPSAIYYIKIHKNTTTNWVDAFILQKISINMSFTTAQGFNFDVSITFAVEGSNDNITYTNLSVSDNVMTFLANSTSKSIILNVLGDVPYKYYKVRILSIEFFRG